MKSLDVIQQLHAVLPLKTDLFTTNLAIQSIAIAGSEITVTTTTDHNLQTNEYVTMYGVVDKNLLTSLTQLDNVASAVTTNNHDLTEGFNDTVTISGADQSDYNGEHTLLSVDNRKEYTFSITGNPVTPATGTIYLNQYFATYGFNGYKQVTVIDTTSFKYDGEFLFGSEADFSSAEVRTKPRISGAITIERAVQSYEAQATNDLWAFVVINNARVSKNRYILNDATDVQTSTSDYRQRIIQDFDIAVFKNAISDISGRYTRDLMEDLLQPFCNSILGVNFPSLLSSASWSGCTLLGHEFNVYNNAYYIHLFRFETVKDLTRDDTSLFDNITVAFRDINIDYLNDNQEISMVSDIDLDTDPL